MELREYQKQAIQAAQDAFARGVKRGVIAFATGMGKTVTAANLMKQRGGRSLFIAPFDAVVSQSFMALQRAIPEKSIGLVRGSVNQYRAETVVASLQTISRQNRLKVFKPEFSTIIIDECHLQIDSYKRVLEAIEGDAFVCGLSATPYRHDSRSLDEVFHPEMIADISIFDGIKMGFLSDIEALEITLKGADFSHVHTRKGELDAKEIESVMDGANWKETITREWLKYASDRRTAVFVASVKMAYDLAEYMREQGIKAEAVDGAMERAKYNALMRRYEIGETQLVVNCTKLSVGWDSPRTDCVLLARPLKSKPLFVQILGRGLRLHPDKKNLLLIDVVGTTKRHDLMSINSLTGTKEVRRGESIRDAKARGEQEQAQKAEEEEQRRKIEEQEIEARRVELLRRQQQREAQQRRTASRWVCGVDNRWTLETHDSIFTIRPTATGMYVVASNRGFRAFAPTVESAMDAAAEEIVKSQMRDPSATWRSKPATEKQLSTLTKFRVQYRDGITSGEASDILNNLFSRRKAA